MAKTKYAIGTKHPIGKTEVKVIGMGTTNSRRTVQFVDSGTIVENVTTHAIANQLVTDLDAKPTTPKPTLSLEQENHALKLRLLEIDCSYVLKWFGVPEADITTKEGQKAVKWAWKQMQSKYHSDHNGGVSTPEEELLTVAWGTYQAKLQFNKELEGMVAKTNY